MLPDTWRKASQSLGNDTCVEVRASELDIFVRDSKNQEAVAKLRFNRIGWRKFRNDVCGGSIRPCFGGTSR
jgi:hypothetical protein